MPVFRRRRRPIPPDEYMAAGDAYVGYLKYAFEWNWQNREGGSFFPLHLAASFGAAHAATALLHSLPESPYFRRPADLDEKALKPVLIRMHWAITYLLSKRIEGGDDLIGDIMRESTAFFARNESEHKDAEEFFERLAHWDSWEARAEQLAQGVASGRAEAPGEIGALSAFVTSSLVPATADPVGEGLERLVTDAEFVAPCFGHGVEVGLTFLDEIEERGWDAVARELSEPLADPDS